MTGDERRAELRRVEDQLWTVYGRTVPDDWAFGIGPVKIRRGIRSMRATQVYVLFNAVAFAAGAVLILTGGAAQDLGIAIVVGALFAFGSFVAQFWGILVQREYEHRKAVFGSDFPEEVVRRLQHRRLQLMLDLWGDQPPGRQEL